MQVVVIFFEFLEKWLSDFFGFPWGISGPRTGSEARGTLDSRASSLVVSKGGPKWLEAFRAMIKKWMDLTNILH